MDLRTEKMLAERKEEASAALLSPKGIARFGKAVKAWVKTHGPMLKIASAAAVIVLFTAYYVLAAKPAQLREQAELDSRAVERLKADAATRQVALDECLLKAKTEAETRWNATCKSQKQRDGCSLSVRLTDEHQQREGEARNACLMRFSLSGQ